MPYEIATDAYYEDLIEWLQENVGQLLWSRPIVEWKGQGWAVNAYGLTKSRTGGSRFIVKIDDCKLATLAALRWSN